MQGVASESVSSVGSVSGVLRGRSWDTMVTSGVCILVSKVGVGGWGLGAKSTRYVHTRYVLTLFVLRRLRIRTTFYGSCSMSRLEINQTRPELVNLKKPLWSNMKGAPPPHRPRPPPSDGVRTRLCHPRRAPPQPSAAPRLPSVALRRRGWPPAGRAGSPQRPAARPAHRRAGKQDQSRARA